MTENQTQPRFQVRNVLRGFFGTALLSTLVVLLEFWISPEENPVFILSRYVGFLVLLALGLLGLFRPRYKSYALGIIIFCLLVVVPLFVLLVSLMTGRQVMRPL